MKQDYVNKMYNYWEICYAFIINVNRLILEILKINLKPQQKFVPFIRMHLQEHLS